MIIRHATLVLVADGKKFILLRNTGTLQNPILTFEGGESKENPATRVQGTDEPGRAFASVGSARSALKQTDFHQIEEDRFAAHVADLLGELAVAGDYDELIVVAPAKSLSTLRDRYSKPVLARLVAEVAKDLTKHPVDEIANILSREG